MTVAPGPRERLRRRGVCSPLAPPRGGKGLMSMDGGILCGVGAEATGRSKHLKQSVCCAGTDREAPHEWQYWRLGVKPSGLVPRSTPTLLGMQVELQRLSRTSIPQTVYRWSRCPRTRGSPWNGRPQSSSPAYGMWSPPRGHGAWVAPGALLSPPALHGATFHAGPKDQPRCSMRVGSGPGVAARNGLGSR